MNQKQSDDFDSLLRKVSNEAEGPYHEQSWLEMEKLLDRKKHRRIFWWPWVFGAALLLLGGWSFFYFNWVTLTPKASNSDETLADFKNEIPSNSMAYAIQATSTHVFNAYDVSSTSKTKKDAITKVDYTALNSTNANQIRPKSSLKSSLSNSTGIPYPTTATTLQRFSDRDYAIKNKYDYTLSENNAVSLAPKSQASVSQISTISGQAHSDEMIDSEVSTNNIHRGHWVIDLLPQKFNLWRDPIGLLYTTPSVHQPITPRNRQADQAILLTAFWAPEFVAVVGRDYGKLVQVFGFKVGFQLNDHFSLLTGLQQSTKNYTAKKDDYYFESSSYFYKLMLNTIYATCKEIEWPVSIQYSRKLSAKNVINLSAGLLSTRMNTELYEYDYYHANGRKGHYKLKHATKKWNWLSSASFSLGYQKNITDRLSFSANPYYNIPLKGIGEGRIKVHALGCQLGLNYKLPVGK